MPGHATGERQPEPPLVSPAAASMSGVVAAAMASLWALQVALRGTETTGGGKPFHDPHGSRAGGNRSEGQCLRQEEGTRDKMESLIFRVFSPWA